MDVDYLAVAQEQKVRKMLAFVNEGENLVAFLVVGWAAAVANQKT